MGLKRARRSARMTQLAVAAAREAVRDAGLRADGDGGTALAANPERVGVVVNSAVGGLPETEDSVEQMHARGPRAVSAYYVPSMIANMPACEVAIDLGLHGPVTASALACASGNAALLEARRLIRSGEADVVIAGGTDAAIAPVMFAGLANIGPLSERNDEPQAGKPPVRRRPRRLRVRRRSGAVRGRVRGPRRRARRDRLWPATRRRAHRRRLPRRGTRAVRRPRRARDLSGARSAPDTIPSEVGYICAHGTGTRANDVAETKAIRMALGDAAQRIPISSPKSMTGHLIAAAGALSALACLLAMRDGVLPPTTNLQRQDPECDLDYIPLTARAAQIDTAMVNAFGFGGQNCVIVLGT